MQIKRIRDPKFRRMNQIPVYNIYMNEVKNIIIEKYPETKDETNDETKGIVQTLIHEMIDMIDLIETNHNFEYVEKVDPPVKRNIFQKIFKKTKTWLQSS